jgi:hypothetical protein
LFYSPCCVWRTGKPCSQPQSWQLFFFFKENPFIQGERSDALTLVLHGWHCHRQRVAHLSFLALTTGADFMPITSRAAGSFVYSLLIFTYLRSCKYLEIIGDQSFQNKRFTATAQEIYCYRTRDLLLTKES